MPADYREIGNEILSKLDIDPTRLGETFSRLSEEVRGCFEREAWSEVHKQCELAHELCNGVQGVGELIEWSDVIDPAHAEGIFHAYAGISHLYRAEEAKGKKNSSKEREEVDKAIHCLKKSQRSFHFEHRDQWNERIICLSLKRLYESQNKLKEALLASQRISCIERTCMLLRALPVINEIAAGKEKPASDDVIGYMRQSDEFEFEFEGQVLKAELLGRSQLTFLPEYDYVAVLVSGDSMDQAGIAPNDYVILRRSKPDSSGHIVAVAFRDEDDKATLKRFYFDKASDSVTLRPESLNPRHKLRVLPLKAFAGDNPPVAIVGIAIAVLKPQSVPKTHPEPEIQQRRFTNICFPKLCKIDQPVLLSIQLTLKPMPGVLPPSEVVVDLTSKEVKKQRGELTVVVSASSFKIDRRSRELSIPFNEDSERIEFELVAHKSGPHTVEIEFFHSAAPVGYVKVFPD